MCHRESYDAFAADHRLPYRRRQDPRARRSRSGSRSAASKRAEGNGVRTFGETRLEVEIGFAAQVEKSGRPEKLAPRQESVRENAFVQASCGSSHILSRCFADISGSWHHPMLSSHALCPPVTRWDLQGAIDRRPWGRAPAPPHHRTIHIKSQREMWGHQRREKTQSHDLPIYKLPMYLNNYRGRLVKQALRLCWAVIGQEIQPSFPMQVEVIRFLP